jgi:hypothetical protein
MGRLCRVIDPGQTQTSPPTEEDAEKRPSSGYDKPRAPLTHLIFVRPYPSLVVGKTKCKDRAAGGMTDDE